MRDSWVRPIRRRSALPYRTLLLSAGLITGGILVLVGSVLPWLTLYAGFHRYVGMIGLYGRLTFAAGTLAFILGLVTLWKKTTRLTWAIAAFGAVLLAFALWLIAGLQEILHRPESVMLVPHPGTGLFLIVTGALLIMLAPIAESAVGRSARG
jgi:hypothetical protein